MDMGKRKASLEAMCDLTVKGHYKFRADGPLIELVFGGRKLHGDGNVKIKIGNQ